MTRTLFCLSMPGGHMSYIATLASCLTGRLSPSDSFITPNGSSHGADLYFPPDFDTPRLENYRPAQPTDEEWNIWHQKAVREYGRDGLCIIKEGWQKYGTDRWRSRLDASNTISIISTMDDPLNLFYCWYNAVDKIPQHVYSRLREKSRLWPSLWWKVTQAKRIHEMCMAMPLYNMGTAPSTSKPSLRINSTDVISADFPTIVNNFLNQNGITSNVNQDIISFHDRFSKRQQDNFIKASKLAQIPFRWEPIGKFDFILHDWYVRTFFEHSETRLAYLNNRTAYLRKY